MSQPCPDCGGKGIVFNEGKSVLCHCRPKDPGVKAESPALTDGTVQRVPKVNKRRGQGKYYRDVGPAGRRGA